MKKYTTYEVCPHCGQEVELKAELMVQTCPHCGKRIVTCSMCRASDTGERYCSLCCLAYQAKKENENRRFSPAYYISEIERMIEEAGTDDISWFGSHSLPSFTRDGVKYEIFSIVLDGPGIVTLLTSAIDPWSGPKDLQLDTSWNVRTLEKVHSLVEKRLSWR